MGEFPVDEKYKAIGPSDDFKHESVAVETTVNTLTPALVPNVMWLEADTDCWIRFDGTDPTAELPALRIVANTLYGPFTVGQAVMQNGIKVIRDSADGTLAVHYGISNKENDRDNDPNA